MKTILGIDAAWTHHQPSGIALIGRSGDKWQCMALAPDYESFYELAQGQVVDWTSTPTGTWPDPSRLVNSCRAIGGAPWVVAIDLPMATHPITARRAADQAISRRFGAQGCSTHSPSALRPGPLSTLCVEQFAAEGYSLETHANEAPSSLIEVYPHVALLALMNLPYRLAYKGSKSLAYWPDSDRPTRLRNLLDVYGRIQDALSQEIDNINLPLPSLSQVSSFAVLKRYEDALDALICAWVGIQYAEGRAVAHGDDHAAIWCPESP
jgi:predicted RNase H-like nuclease